MSCSAGSKTGFAVAEGYRRVLAGSAPVLRDGGNWDSAGGVVSLDASRLKGGMFTTSIPYFQFLALLDAVTQYANDARRFAQAQASRGSRPS